MSREPSPPSADPPDHAAGTDFPKGSGLEEAARRKGSFVQTLKAVGWSFFGVRKSNDHHSDMGQLNPVHVIIVGIVSAIAFVVLLIVLIQWIVSSGVAA